MNGRVLALLLAAVVAGCVTGESGVGLMMEGVVADAERTRRATQIEPDPHSGVTTVAGPLVTFSNGLDFHVYRLRAFVDPRKPRAEDVFQILVRGEFEHRVYLDQAYALGAELPTVVIDRQRVCDYGCVTWETLGVGLTAAELESWAATGLVFRIAGRRDDLLVRVPAGHFAGFLAAYRAMRDTV